MILCTGETGTPLREIISSLGNKNYPFIRCRCKYKNTNGIMCDEFWEFALITMEFLHH